MTCMSFLPSLELVMVGRTYLISERVLRRLGRLICQRCGRLVLVGELVISRNTKRGVKHYHRLCWDDMRF